MIKPVFYRPNEGVCADFIPFFDEGEFKLFYLRDFKNEEKYGKGTPWYLITTKDFIDFADIGVVIPRGESDEQDAWVFTGCVIKAKGQYHIFYTGHSPEKRAVGLPEQLVMHAVSDDLVKWVKLPEDTFGAPQDQYDMHDWRDPFVFYNTEAEEYWMLLAARFKNGAPTRRRGCTALCASKDLKSWEVRKPFWEPNSYFTHECPDLFKMGEWWYLIFSEFNDSHVTRYIMSKSLNGPWIVPKNDAFDTRAFYAGKTASDGVNRYIFGWNPTKVGETDFGNWEWGGALVVHQLVQMPDGTLNVKVPQAVNNLFNNVIQQNLTQVFGKNVFVKDDTVSIRASDSFACAMFDDMPIQCKIEAKFKYDGGSKELGIILRADEEVESCYYIEFQPCKNRVVLDKWPRPWDMPYLTGMERPLVLSEGEENRIKIFADDTVGILYVNDEIALNFRMYDNKIGRFGVFAQNAQVEFYDIKIITK